MDSRDDMASTASRDTLHRTLYLRREYALVSKCGEFGDILLVPPRDDCDECQQNWWCGLLSVLRFPSPWYRGVFPFRVYFPPKYPFEAPTVRMEAPLKSHPLLLEDCEGGRSVVPFDNVYIGLDPMRVSVMARLLHHVRSLFYPAEWPAVVHVNKALARYDVERRSATQEVVLGKPYVDYLSREAIAFFTNSDYLESSETCVDASGCPEEEWEKRFSLWLGRTWLPSVRILQ
ncbi:Ubiquitin-conjugating enzyme E2 [Trypanosoma melophagium]|uniref:Ubiquitin-conjugating enzyme E2 n=1 Tax=Trypanosoma melophagium TaxID=715481 RepID=UPI00351AAC6B|nr:Ubiquitin-conjugating enzyme E2 [Trypanosoma melophagium]